MQARRAACPDHPLDRAFYDRDAAALAEALIGKVLVRRLRRREYRARIVETEAYVGPEDLACHSSKGRTKRTEVMFGPPGHAYVYLIYGMYDMFNIVAGPAGGGQAVLIRAAEPIKPLDVDLSGPGRLARGLKITRADNATDLTCGSLVVLDGAAGSARIGRARRVGVDYAKHWADALLRFYDLDSPAVSKPRPKP